MMAVIGEGQCGHGDWHEHVQQFLMVVMVWFLIVVVLVNDEW